MKKCLYIFLISSFCLAVISCDTKSNTSDSTSIDNTTTTVRIWIPLDGGRFYGGFQKTSPDGRKYVGKFKDIKKHGQGTETFPDGTKYEGEFKEGIPNGQGKMTYSDGSKHEGEYKNGRPWNTIVYDRNGKIIGKYVNRKYIRE